MAKLINCKLCKSEMSSKADKCPKCGEKIHRTSPIAWVLLLVILYFLYMVLTGTPTKTPTKTSTAQDFLNASKDMKAAHWNNMSESEQKKASEKIWNQMNK
ncbi:hypothetical protein [Aliarcobacter butzleri]|uniref:hypothetical protein n=1 Tax=Aliarcobacter butzleri TaxID=28197 RepID=UPI002B24B197|nr:hypothetical protein [Aliarcobacter butzleri]